MTPDLRDFALAARLIGLFALVSLVCSWPVSWVTHKQPAWIFAVIFSMAAGQIMWGIRRRVSPPVWWFALAFSIACLGGGFWALWTILQT